MTLTAKKVLTFWLMCSLTIVVLGDDGSRNCGKHCVRCEKKPLRFEKSCTACRGRYIVDDACIGPYGNIPGCEVYNDYGCAYCPLGSIIRENKDNHIVGCDEFKGSAYEITH